MNNDRSHSDGPDKLRVDNAIKMSWRLSRDEDSCRGRQRLRTRDVVGRDTEVAEDVEGTAKVKNERRGEERTGGGKGCGGQRNGRGWITATNPNWEYTVERRR